MEDTKLEKLARLSGKATSKALDALGKHGFDIRGKLSAPISRVPRRVSAKNARLKGDPTSIYNWRRLDDRITTSGQPTEPQLADIHALGVRHIINLGLHTHEKALPNEAASVSRLGVTYIHIPVDFQKHAEAMGSKAIVAQTADELKQALNDARKADRVTVIVVPVDPEKRMPGMGTWWDVPVAEVSGEEKTRKTRETYEKATENQRPVFA